MSSQNPLRHPGRSLLRLTDDSPDRRPVRIPYRLRVRIVGVAMTLAFLALIFVAFFGLEA